jgi:hypothetical protein
MSVTPERRLYAGSELPDLLQLSPEQISWLVQTRQLHSLKICGETRFDSRDLDRLIENYKLTASRRVQ